MPNYVFRCEGCGEDRGFYASIHVGPPASLLCECGDQMLQVFFPPQIHCQGDADEVPPEFGIQRLGHTNGTSKAEADRIEAKFQADIERKRAMKRERGLSKRGKFEMTHSIPAPLYHGKIRQTGDPNYWKDEKNLNRHKSVRV